MAHRGERPGPLPAGSSRQSRPSWPVARSKEPAWHKSRASLIVRRPCSSKRRGRSRAGIHIYQWAPAARQQPCCAPQVMAARTWQRRPEAKQGQPSPRGYVWSAGSKERLGQQASWGPGVPTSGCLRQRGSKATARADRPPEWLSPGCLGPRPWLFGAARSQGKAHIDNLRGSWVPSLAVCASSSNPGGNKQQGLRTPTTQYKGTAVQTRDVSSAPPKQGLGCQWATCTLQVVCTRAGHTGTSTGVLPGQGAAAGSLTPVGSASMAPWEPGDEEAPQPRKRHTSARTGSWAVGAASAADPEPGSATGSATRVRAGL